MFILYNRCLQLFETKIKAIDLMILLFKCEKYLIKGIGGKTLFLQVDSI